MNEKAKRKNWGNAKKERQTKDRNVREGWDKETMKK